MTLSTDSDLCSKLCVAELQLLDRPTTVGRSSVLPVSVLFMLSDVYQKAGRCCTFVTGPLITPAARPAAPIKCLTEVRP